MNELLGWLLRFDWVAFSLFMVAVACLFFCIWVGSQFAEEITAEDIPPPIPPIIPQTHRRRKNDHADR